MEKAFRLGPSRCIDAGQRSRPSSPALGLILAFAAQHAISTPCWAGGFYAPYHSGLALGSALAGSSARSDDATFLFYNPAIIADLDGATATVEARGFLPSIRIEVERATSPLGNDVTASGGSGEMTDFTAGPGAFAAVPLTRNLWLGIGGSGHFAVDIEADPEWAGRYQLLKTRMLGVNLSAALAYRVTDWLTVAGGVQVQEFTAEFEKMEVVPTPFGLVEARGFLKGEDWSAGYTAGILLSPAVGTRIGIGYRSKLDHTLEGRAGADLPGIPGDTATFDINLPDVVSVGLEQRIGPDLRLFAEWERVRWSRFTGLEISFGSGRPNELRPQDWDDTWMAALGFGYKLDPLTELTAGVHYDTPVSTGGSNTLSPDGARTMVAAGLSHEIVGRGQVSAHYAHVFFDDAPINVSDPRSGSLAGTFKGSLDVFGLSLRMDW